MAATKLGLFGACLSQEELAGLEVALHQRQMEEKLPSPLSFWGKIIGEENDYFIAYSLTPAFGFPTKKFYFATSNNIYALKQLPDVTEETTRKSLGVTGRFRGDPSFPLEEEVVDPAAEEGAPPPDTFRELHRLAVTVSSIDGSCSVVPVGSFVSAASKQIVANGSYAGLSYEAAGNLRSYLHFRAPRSALAMAANERAGIARPGDIFDSCTDDAPKGVWSLNYDSTGTHAVLKNAYWNGYCHFQTVGEPTFGGVYFGIGVPNLDLAFGL